MTAAARPPTKKPKRDKPLLEEVPAEGHPGNSKFARTLGSVDYQTREKGLHALKSFLLRKTDLKEPDMMKIWKGLFYCFWHSDKTPVQAELAERLAAMLTQLSEESAFLFFKCFVATMRREWFGIDRHRLDKFLMLVRKFINKMLACLKAAKWRPDLLQRYADHLHHHVVCPGDTLPAAGLAYHCGDVLLDELRLVADGRPVPGQAVAAVLAPFAAALQRGEQVLLHRIGEGLFETLVSELETPTDDSPYLQQLDTAALASQLFDLGAGPSTKARNRQVLYELSGVLERMQRKRRRIDTGTQASSATTDEPTAKAAKKQAKKAKQVESAPATAAPADALHSHGGADGDAGAAGTAAPRPSKRKVAQAEAAAHVQMPEEDAQPEGDQAQTPMLKGLKKKKRTILAKQQEQLQEAAAGPSSVATHVISNGTGHREPTSGQKAALRASVSKVGLQPKGATPGADATLKLTPASHGGKKAAKAAKAVEPAPAAVDANAGTPSAAPLTPADVRGKKGGANTAKAVQQAATTPQAANGHVAATTPATAGKLSALGKRSAPGTGVKSAAKGAAQGGVEEQAQANGVQANKTPVQAAGAKPARKRAVTTAKKGRVVINLKKNLYFEHGGPVPGLDVRTPPPARAKGGILKTSAKTCPPKVSVAHTPAAVLAKQQQQAGPGKQQARVLPKNARRASAALFF